MSDLASRAVADLGSKGIVPIQFLSISNDQAVVLDAKVPEEGLACISVNGVELATLMCTPHLLEQLALGFLFNEGIIERLDEVRHLRLSKQGSCVDVWLYEADRPLPKRAIITAGCGGGVTFDDLTVQHAPLNSGLTATVAQVAELMRGLHLGASLYQEARGIHTAVLADRDVTLLQVEDIGRHNCIDRIGGAALQQGVSTHDRILLSSGRISSEMLNKARRMGVPIVCSRTSPTSLSVALAKAWQITLVAYVRGKRMRVYSHPERIVVG